MPKSTSSASSARANQTPNNQLKSGVVPYYDNLWDMVHGRASRQPTPTLRASS